MKFAICNEMFEGWSFQDVCAAARDAGYSGVEVAPFTLGKPVAEISPQERESIRKTADLAEIDIVGLHWCLAQTTGLHLTSPDAQVRDRTALYLNDLTNLCADIGGNIIVFGSPRQRNVPEGVSYRQAKQYAIEVFRKAATLLEKRNVTLCLEPLSPAETDFINTADEAEEIISDIGSPNIGLILDVKAMSSESEPIDQIIRRHRSRLRHFHANDANLRGPGFGNTDFTPIAAALASIKYDGWISVEVFDFSPDPLTIAVKSIQYLKSAFDAERSKL